MVSGIMECMECWSVPEPWTFGEEMALRAKESTSQIVSSLRAKRGPYLVDLVDLVPCAVHKASNKTPQFSRLRTEPSFWLMDSCGFMLIRCVVCTSATAEGWSLSLIDLHHQSLWGMLIFFFCSRVNADLNLSWGLLVYSAFCHVKSFPF